MSENKTLTAILAIISIFLLGAVAFGLTQIDGLNAGSKSSNMNANSSKNSLVIPKNGEINNKIESTIISTNVESKVETSKLTEESKKEISSAKETAIPENKPNTLIQVAAINPEISIFLSAVKAAGLEDTLKSEGPFTIFAPDNESFTKYLPSETLTELQKPEKKEDLARALKFHIVSGTKLSKDLNDSEQLTTLENGVLTISEIEGHKKSVDNIEIIKPDIIASNGVIHVINRVIGE